MPFPGNLSRSWIWPFTSGGPAAKCSGPLWVFATEVKRQPAEAVPNTFTQPCTGCLHAAAAAPRLSCFPILPYYSKAAKEFGVPPQSVFCRQKHGGPVNSALSWDAASIFRPLAHLLFWDYLFQIRKRCWWGFFCKRCCKICHTDALFPLKVTPTNAQHSRHSVCPFLVFSSSCTSQLPVPGPGRMSCPYFINCKNQDS